jgi:hypothetical protein
LPACQTSHRWPTGEEAGGGTVAAVRRSDLLTRVSMTIAASVLLLGTFLPWVRSGRRERNSYELLGLVDRLGFAPDGWVERFVRWWPIVPLLVVAAVVCAWWHRHVASVVLALVAIVYAAVVAWELADRPGPALVGITLTLVGCALLLLATAWQAAVTVRVATRRGSPAPTSAPSVDRS